MERVNYLVGIDEVGRGPLAGPITVAALCFANTAAIRKVIKKTFPILRDSKQLSAAHRREWFARIKKLRDDGMLSFALSFVSAPIIDRDGIAKATRIAIARCLKKIEIQATDTILLDGGLKAPSLFTRQKTIIRGDETELSIALASIVAKVVRDRRMARYAKAFPQYGFEVHKGYGTKAHYATIKKYGLSPLHRRSFLKGLRK